MTAWKKFFSVACPLLLVVAMGCDDVNTPPPRPSSISEIEIPADFEDLVLACLSKDPAQRPPTCETLAQALEVIQLAEPWTRERAADWWQMHVPETNATRCRSIPLCVAPGAA